MSKPYAGTDVSVAKSQHGIQSLLKKYDATRIVTGETMADTYAVEWSHSEIRYRVEMPMGADEKEERRLWRVLYWAIKSKLEAVASGMEEYEMAFMAQMIDPFSGSTLSQIIRPAIDAGHFNYGGGGMKALTSGEVPL